MSLAPSRKSNAPSRGDEAVSFEQVPGRATLRGGTPLSSKPAQRAWKGRATLAREGAYGASEEKEAPTASMSMGTGARFPHSRQSLMKNSTTLKTKGNRARASFIEEKEKEEEEEDEEDEEDEEKDESDDEDEDEVSARHRGALFDHGRAGRQSESRGSIKGRSTLQSRSSQRATMTQGEKQDSVTSDAERRSSLQGRTTMLSASRLEKQGTTQSIGLKARLSFLGDIDDDAGSLNQSGSIDVDFIPQPEKNKSATMSDLVAFVQKARNLRASVHTKKVKETVIAKKKQAAIRDARRDAEAPVTSTGLDAFLGAKAIGIRKLLWKEKGTTVTIERREKCQEVREQYQKTLELSKTNPGRAAEASSRIYLGHLALLPASDTPYQMKACSSVTERRLAIKQQLQRFFMTYVANPPINVVCDFDPLSVEPHCPSHIIIEFCSPEEAREALEVCRRLGRTDGESHPPERVAWGYCGYAWGAEEFRPSHAGQGKSKIVPKQPSGAARRYNVPAYEEGPQEGPSLLPVYHKNHGPDDPEEVIETPVKEKTRGRLTFSASPASFKESYYGPRMGGGR